MAKDRSSSLLELTKGRWREFRREPSAFFFVIFMPILWMAILGFAFSNSTAETYGIGWPVGGDVEPSDLGRTAREALQRNERIKLHEGSSDELSLLLKRGDIQLVVEVSAKAVQFYYDPANRQAAHARAFVNDIVQQAAGRLDPVLAADEKIDVPGTRYIDFLVPGLLALSIMTSSLFGTGMLIVSARRENLLKRYLATPMRPAEYVVSHIFGRGFVLAVEVATILLAGFLMFRFQIAGRYATLLLFSCVGAAAFTSMAILCASRTASPAAMNGMTNLISVPMMLVSGVWFSRANFPDWIAAPARFLPLSALVDGLRKIALEGLGFGALGVELAVLAAYAVVTAVAATLAFKWY